MIEKRKEDRRKEPADDRREEFAYLNVPGLDYMSLGDRRQIQRRGEDQESSLQSRHPLF